MRRAFHCCVLLVVVAGCRTAPGPSVPPAEEVTFSSVGGQGRGLLLVPGKGETPRPAIVVLHGDFGLNEIIRRHARRLADKGYLVLAVDLYRGEQIKQNDLMHAHEVDRALEEERVRADLRGALDLLVRRQDVKSTGVGIIGWDMGGGYALDTAIVDPRLAACVSCYGRLTTDPAELRKMKGAFLGIYAGKDEGNPRETLAAFEEAMKEAGKPPPTLRVFAECDHGFMNPSAATRLGPADEKATSEAWEAIETFFAATLRRANGP